MESDLRERIARALYETSPAYWGHEPGGPVAWEVARHNGVKEHGRYAEADAVIAVLTPAELSHAA